MRQGFPLQSTLALVLHVLTGALLPQVAWADQKCSSLGFGGAWLNPCGYCVGGNTGLERTHGRDCRGTCGGTARRDCNGVCAGGAYVEPCSGQCVCMSREKATLMCGSCVGGNGTVTKADVLDGCGNCKTSKSPCLCDGARKDECGECNGKGASCFVLKAVRPSAVPADVDVQVTLEGAFNGESRDVLCVFRKREATSAESGEPPPPITAAGRGNGTVFVCQPRTFSQDRSKKRVLVPPQGSAPSWFTQCRVPFPKTSGDFVVYPSLDGQHPPGDGFQPLAVRDPAADQDVLHHGRRSAVVLFDRAVNVCLASGCERILSGDTLSALGPLNVQCRWATKQQLVVHLAKPASGDKVKIVLNSDNVVEDKQAVIWNVGDELCLRDPAWLRDAVRSLSTCSTPWPLGPVEAFAWSAVRNDSAPLEDYLKAKLKGTNTPFLELDAEELEVDMEYRFTVKVTADSKNVAELSHALIHRDVNAPVVVIYTDAMMNGQQVSPENE
ncbi:hypothetical protein MTO96_004820 [Rhipicephalus appendiculatus]